MYSQNCSDKSSIKAKYNVRLPWVVLNRIPDDYEHSVQMPPVESKINIGSRKTSETEAEVAAKLGFGGHAVKKTAVGVPSFKKYKQKSMKPSVKKNAIKRHSDDLNIFDLSIKKKKCGQNGCNTPVANHINSDFSKITASSQGEHSASKCNSLEGMDRPDGKNFSNVTVNENVIPSCSTVSSLKSTGTNKSKLSSKQSLKSAGMNKSKLSTKPSLKSTGMNKSKLPAMTGISKPLTIPVSDSSGIKNKVSPTTLSSKNVSFTRKRQLGFKTSQMLSKSCILNDEGTNEHSSDSFGELNSSHSESLMDIEVDTDTQSIVSSEVNVSAGPVEQNSENHSGAVSEGSPNVSPSDVHHPKPSELMSGGSVLDDEYCDKDELQIDYNLSLGEKDLYDESESEDEHSYKRRPRDNQHLLDSSQQKDVNSTESSTDLAVDPSQTLQTNTASRNAFDRMTDYSRHKTDINTYRKDPSVVASQQKSNRRSSIPNVSGYCYNFLARGICERLACKFRHCFPSIQKGQTFLNFLQEYSDKGFYFALKFAYENIVNEKPVVQCKAILILLIKSILIKDENFVKCVIDFIKPEILTTSFCLELIMTCRQEPSITLHVLHHVFSLCQKRCIHLSEETNIALLEAFGSQGPDWSSILSVMEHMHLVCKQIIPVHIFENVLRSVNETSSLNLTEKMEALLKTLGEQYLTNIDSSFVKTFIEKSRNQCSSSSYNQNCSTGLSDQLLWKDDRFVMQIRNYVFQERWVKVLELFEVFVINGKGELFIEELHETIFSCREHLGEKYLKFIRCISGTPKDINMFKKILLGQLGAVLLLEAHDLGYMEAAFDVLQAMHSYGFDYKNLQHLGVSEETWKPKLVAKIFITDSWVALVAVDVCVNTGRYMDALHILKETSWAVPPEKLDPQLRNHELSFRVRLLMKLCSTLLKENPASGVEVMDVLLTAVVHDFKTEVTPGIIKDLNELYSDYMVLLLNKREPDQCYTLYKHMHDLYTVVKMKTIILRSLIILWFPTNMKNAEDLFNSAFLTRRYPIDLPSQLLPRHALTLPSYLSKAEYYFILNLYMNRLFGLIEGIGHTPSKDDCPSVSIIIKEIDVREKEPYLCHVHEMKCDIIRSRKRLHASLFKLFKEKYCCEDDLPKDIIGFSPGAIYLHFMNWKQAQEEINSSRYDNIFHIGSNFQASTHIFGNTTTPSSMQVKSEEDRRTIPQCQDGEALSASAVNEIAHASTCASETSSMPPSVRRNSQLRSPPLPMLEVGSSSGYPSLEESQFSRSPSPKDLSDDEEEIHSPSSLDSSYSTAAYEPNSPPPDSASSVINSPKKSPLLKNFQSSRSSSALDNSEPVRTPVPVVGESEGVPTSQIGYTHSYVPFVNEKERSKNCTAELNFFMDENEKSSFLEFSKNPKKLKESGNLDACSTCSENSLNSGASISKGSSTDTANTLTSSQNTASVGYRERCEKPSLNKHTSVTEGNILGLRCEAQCKIFHFLKSKISLNHPTFSKEIVEGKANELLQKFLAMEENHDITKLCKKTMKKLNEFSKLSI